VEFHSIVLYFIKISAIQGLFYAFYFLALKNKTTHALNRGYLLTSVIFSFIIPIIRLPVIPEVQPMLNTNLEEWIAIPLTENMVTNMPTDSSASIFWPLLKWVYSGILGAFLLRSFLHLYFIEKIKNHSELMFSHWFSLYKVSHLRPFSFLTSVFIPTEKFGTADYDQILAHECEHVRQWHSIDRLVMDFFVSLLWFNPFIYLYRNALIEVHEFQADAAVINQFRDPIGYQEMLYCQLQPASKSGIMSHFNFSTIKKRIVMMNRTKSVGYSRLVYGFALPLMAIVLIAFTSKEVKLETERVEKPIEVNDSFDSKGFSASIEQEDVFKPSILPLKAEGEFKVSSTYGMRTDPITKAKKQHKGLDLATKIGTEVISTADGEVVEVVASPSGYGNHIVIKHGDIYMTKYGQLSEFKVKGGDVVVKGQLIALTGNSGQSTGPHLHYEVYKNKEDVNPMDYITNYKFSK
jgi:hypothetical protein